MKNETKERTKEELKDEVNKMMSNEPDDIDLEILEDEDYDFEFDDYDEPKKKKSKKRNKKRRGKTVRKVIRAALPYVGSFIAGAGTATGFMIAIGGKHNNDTDIPKIEMDENNIGVNDFVAGTEGVTEF